MTLGPVKHTSRGFQIIEFTDRYGETCTLQQSSLADYESPGSSAVWLGSQEERMHLDREQAKALIAVLKHWIDTGSLDVTDAAKEDV